MVASRSWSRSATDSVPSRKPGETWISSPQTWEITHFGCLDPLVFTVICYSSIERWGSGWSLQTSLISVLLWPPSTCIHVHAHTYTCTHIYCEYMYINEHAQRQPDFAITSDLVWRLVLHHLDTYSDLWRGKLDWENALRWLACGQACGAFACFIILVRGSSSM